MSAVTETLAIGEIDQTVFDCPKCSRPLAVGARRCPGCRTRLVLGVAVGKVSVFVSGGLAFGLLLGGGLGVAVGLGRATPVAAGEPVGAIASHAPVNGPIASGLPPVTDPVKNPGDGSGSGAMPSMSRSALIQAATVNDRLEAGAAALRSSLASSRFDAGVVAQTLRTISADSVYGLQLADNVSGWTESAEVGADLSNFYADVHTAAADALVDSVQNPAAYRQSAKAMVSLLGGVSAVDGRIEALATANGVIFPSPSVAP